MPVNRILPWLGSVQNLMFIFKRPKRYTARPIKMWISNHFGISRSAKGGRKKDDRLRLRRRPPGKKAADFTFRFLIWCDFNILISEFWIHKTEQSALHTELHGCWWCPQAPPRRSLLPRRHRRARSFLASLPCFPFVFFMSASHCFAWFFFCCLFKRVFNLFITVNNPKTTLNEAFLGLLYPTLNYKV